MLFELVLFGCWKFVGEICDGKCYVGVMCLGWGLVYKVCVDFCLIGGILFVFVFSGDVEGCNFFLMVDVEGNLFGDEIKLLLVLYVELEGEVEWLDDLMVFKIDLLMVRFLK